MIDTLTTWFKTLPAKYKMVGMALVAGFLIGGGTAESLQLLGQVTNNKAELEQVENRLVETRAEMNHVAEDVRELDAKLDRVLCILDPAQAEFPLACERGGGE